MSDLLAHLNSTAEPTQSDVLTYLAERSQWGHNNAGSVMPVDQFYRSEDLDHYLAAVAWWPKHAPKNLPRPYLGLLLNHIVTHAPLTPTTFYDELMRQTQKVCAWLESEGGNVANPNETPEERKRRKGREAVARHRDMAASPDPAVANVKQLHAAYIEACRVRKAAYDEHSPAVDAAKAAWEQAKAGLTT